MSDRDTYVADPAFVQVPTDILLSPEFALARTTEMTTKAFDGPVMAGEIPGFGGQRQGREQTGQSPHPLSSFNAGQDTSQISVIDSQGNAVVITPSDFPKSPMLPDTGINLGDRMTQFQLDPKHVNALQPGKRPRITPHAVIVFQDDHFHLAFSTPGGDMQAQALVQVFLNMQLFGMDIQQAISAPRFYSINSPSSFSPHEATPAGLRLEQSLYAEQAQALSELGYKVQQDPDWDKDFGAVGGILKSENGKLLVGADPREETTAAAR
jgi:gamma-glutamyltranspeptidase/glutathione hydrolase